MSFFHGVRTQQVPTAITPTARVNASLAMAFGAAPIHRLAERQREAARPGTIHLLFNSQDAGERMGITSTDKFGYFVEEDEATNQKQDYVAMWGLSEVAFSQFQLFGNAPVIFANLFDPDVHFGEVLAENVSVVNGKAQLKQSDIYSNPRVYVATDVFEEGVDYDINLLTGVVTILSDGAMADLENFNIDYKYPRPDLIDVMDCIGGFDIETGKNTGLELVGEAFTRFRMAPGLLLAPGFSEDPMVAAIMAAKTDRINGVFRAGSALVDIPSDGPNGVKLFTDVPAYKNDNNIVSPDQYVCWPKVQFGDMVFHMSTQAAGVIGRTDRNNSDVPYESPSNKNLQATGLLAGGKEVALGLEQANFLNANGITTGLNFINGWVLWGNRTAAFPANLDPKDSFLVGRRMFAWVENRFVLTWWDSVDGPMNHRLINTILNSTNIDFNSLVASGALLGGRIEFREEQNSLLNLVDGQMRFHLSLGLVTPAESIEGGIEFDTSYVLALFS